ncbi:hypothetical protein HID58_035624, partial [Brassica napus]
MNSAIPALQKDHEASSSGSNNGAEAHTSPSSVRRLQLIILTDRFHRNSRIRYISLSYPDSYHKSLIASFICQFKRSISRILHKRMSGFRAFKAQVPIQWSESLYITLVRGLPGTRKLHRRTLEAMGLRRCHRTVLHSNTSSIRGMIQQRDTNFKRVSFGEQVKRMVVVEPEEMFKARKEASQPQSSPPSVCCQSFNPCNRLIQHVLSISEDANKKC